MTHPTDSRAPAATAAPSLDPARPATTEGFLPLFLAVLTGGLLVLGLQLWQDWTVPRPAPVAQRPAYVIVDSDTLLQAQLQQSFSQPGRRADAAAPQVAAEMQQALASAFERYTQQGLAVLHKAAVIAAPPALDVTAAVAQDLGIPPEFLDNARRFQRTGELPAIAPVAESAPVSGAGAAPSPAPPPPRPLPAAPDVP